MFLLVMHLVFPESCVEKQYANVFSICHLKMGGMLTYKLHNTNM